ncbi:MAG: hypothetical protein KatS3mg125_0477 [Lysobacterales bacterium]|jgi:hypothetical protein|nr:MAG: hypothetical protein KatS3mg125_0477 [Xanthomonadales bacterium]
MPRRKTNIVEINQELEEFLKVIQEQAALKIYEYGMSHASNRPVDLNFIIPLEDFDIDYSKLDPQSVNQAIKKAAALAKCEFLDEILTEDRKRAFRFRVERGYISELRAKCQRKLDESRWLKATCAFEFAPSLFRLRASAEGMEEFYLSALLVMQRGFLAVSRPTSTVVLEETSGDAASAKETTAERGAPSESEPIVFITREGAGPESVLPVLIAARLAQRGRPVVFERWRGRNRRRRWRVSGFGERALARFDALPARSEDAEPEFPERAYRIVHGEGSSLLRSAKLAEHGHRIVILLPPYFDPGFAMKIWRARKRLAKSKVLAAPIGHCGFPCHWCHPINPLRSVFELWAELCWNCSLRLLPRLPPMVFPREGLWSWSPLLSPLFGAAAEHVELELSERELNEALESVLRALEIPQKP